MSEPLSQRPAAEQYQPGPLVLAEQQRIADKLDAVFADPAAPNSFALATAASLLEAANAPFIAAGSKAGVFDRGRQSGAYSALQKGVAVSKYNLSRTEVWAINNRTELRTQSLNAIVTALDISRQMAAEIIGDNGLQPIFRVPDGPTAISFLFDKPEAGYSYAYGGWYDLDQVEVIRQNIGQFNAPPGLIGQTNILNTTGMSPKAFVALCEQLGIEGEMYRNPEVGHSEYHFKETDVLVILQRVLPSRRSAAHS